LRSKSAVDPIKFTLSSKYQQKFVDEDSSNTIVEEPKTRTPYVPTEKPKFDDLSVEDFPQACSLDDPDCLACSA
jgi:ribonucleoside-diphosphate reductase alpha chain